MAKFDDPWLRLRVKRDILYIKEVETVPIPVFHRKSGLSLHCGKDGQENDRCFFLLSAVSAD